MKALVILSVMAFIFLVKSNPDTIKSILSQFENKPKKELFKVYHFLFKKEYDLNSEEGLRRYKIFKDNLAYINKVNAEKKEYTLGLTDFADMTNQEYREKMTMRPEALDKLRGRVLRDVNFDKEADNEEEVAPQKQFGEINWIGYFLPARHQGYVCGSCWAFTTCAIMEGALGIKNGYRFPEYLSPQQLVDCDIQNNYGCHGGFPDYALNYIQTNGIYLEKQYPYIEKDSQCRVTNYKGPYTVRGFNYCSPRYYKQCTKESWLSLLAAGPIAVLVDADSQDFQLFQGGLFNVQCNQYTHAVTAVAYSPATDIYTIRNSWGQNWGESGYFRIKENPANRDTCFVRSEAISPIL